MYKVRFVRANKPGYEVLKDQVLSVVTRSGSDEETLLVLAEALKAESPLSSFDFELFDLPPGPVVATVITAKENDPELWEEVRDGWCVRPLREL